MRCGWLWWLLLRLNFFFLRCLCLNFFRLFLSFSNFSSFFLFRGSFFLWLLTCGSSGWSFSISINFEELRVNSYGFSFLSEVLLYYSWICWSNIYIHFISLNHSYNFICLNEFSFLLYEALDSALRDRVSHLWNFDHLSGKKTKRWISHDQGILIRHLESCRSGVFSNCLECFIADISSWYVS